MITNKKILAQRTNFDSLYDRLRQSFASISDHRAANCSHKLLDVLGSAFAMFSLKSPSLLAFESRSKEEEGNLHRIFQLSKIPSDTQMRRTLDGVCPSHLRKCFLSYFKLLEELRVVADYEFFKGMNLLSIDGVEHFRSTKIHCEQCTQKRENNGELSYHHAMLAAVMIHPDKKEVFPLDGEAIICQDGVEKNDCERNAAKRLLDSLAQHYGEKTFVLVEDALYANGPHIRQINDLNWHYIINVKPKGNKALFAQVQGRRERKQLKKHQFTDQKGYQHVFEYTSEVALNEAATDIRTNFIYYEQHSPKGKVTRFSWVTDLPLNVRSIIHIMRAARARWKIENETFNTLKNQGYHFEHNYGHGHQYLCTVLALLMFLAFTVDQIQQHCSKVFQALHKGLKTKVKLWEAMKSFFKVLPFKSMNQLFIKVADSYSIQLE